MVPECKLPDASYIVAAPPYHSPSVDPKNPRLQHCVDRWASWVPCTFPIRKPQLSTSLTVTRHLFTKLVLIGHLLSPNITAPKQQALFQTDLFKFGESEVGSQVLEVGDGLWIIQAIYVVDLAISGCLTELVKGGKYELVNNRALNQ